MYPELFTIPGTSIAIHSFGLMMVLGLLGAMWLAKRMSRHVGVDGELFVNTGILALISGIAGARLSHVLENLGEYTRSDRTVLDNLWAAVNVTSGGLTYYGGFILAFVVCFFYVRKVKIPVRAAMDIAAPCVMVGLALGRIGCFLNGCCYGSQCDLPWSVRFPYDSPPYVEQVDRGQVTPPEQLVVQGADGRSYLVPGKQAANNPLLQGLVARERSLPLHPAQLYSAAMALLIAGICVAHFTTPHAAGRGMALMMMLEGSARFVLESIRAEPARVRFTLAGTEYGWSHSMIVGLFIVGIGMALWLVLGHLARRDQQTPQPAV